MPTELFANEAETSLSAAVLAGSTAVLVVSSAAFPAAVAGASQFRARLSTLAGTAHEYVLVTNVAGLTWTVTRGIEGSTPAAWTVGTVVSQVVTVASLAAPPLSATVVYADPAGLDTNDGLSAGRPKATLQAAHDALPAAGGTIRTGPGTFTVSTTTTFSRRVEWMADRTVLAASAATFPLLTLQAGASASRVSGVDFRGAATSGATGQYGISTVVGNVPTDVSVLGCVFGQAGATSLNSGVKLDTGCDRWRIRDCDFVQLWGTASGVGYGVLVGTSSKVRIKDCRFEGAPGRGRHFAYLTAGCAYCEVTGNTVTGTQGSGIGVYSTSGQAANTHNRIVGNLLVSCGSGTTESAGIELTGDCADNTVSGNRVVSPNPHGIIVTDGGNGGLCARNRVDANRVSLASAFGIFLLGAKQSSVVGNTVYNSSQSSPGTYAGIRVSSSGSFGTQVCDRTWVTANHSYGGDQRNAADIDSSAPAPTNSVFNGNVWGLGQVGGLTLNGVTASDVGNVSV